GAAADLRICLHCGRGVRVCAPLAYTRCAWTRSSIASMNRHARQRFRIVLVMVFCLLFQQAALAAYLCPLEQMPAETSTMTKHCAEMGMAQKQDNPALCQKHCSPDHSIAADAVKLT